MKNYIYDNTFHGLLTAIYDAFYNRESSINIYSGQPIQQSLLDTDIFITTDETKAQKVYNSIIEKISKSSMRNIYYAFLSNDTDRATHIYEYLRLGFKTGPNTDLNLSDDRVFKINRLWFKVMKEVHLLTGIIRFRQISENLYYASIEPDNNVLELLAPHFCNRMADQNFIIHDIKRGIGLMYNRNTWMVAELSTDSLPTAGKKELNYQELWKQYFKNIAIKERLNPKVQRNFMPKRYWKHLIEKQNTDISSMELSLIEAQTPKAFHKPLPE